MPVATSSPTVTMTAERLAPGVTPSPAERLERGAVLVFPPGAVPLPDEDDLRFLREELGERITLKNISYHPEGGYLSGLKRGGGVFERAKRILAERDGVARTFLSGVLPDYARDWHVGKVNYRPLEERGRQISRHSSNELVHVDAFASGATHGDRVLRFFTNVNPTEPRVWRSAGLFPELYREFGESAGILPARLGAGPAERAFSGLLRGLAGMGLGQARMVDTSPYDRAMKRLHDRLKDDDAFQQDEARMVAMEFEPLSSWCVLTDMVSHACVRGRHALVNTYYVPLERCAVPELAPFHVMGG